MSKIKIIAILKKYYVPWLIGSTIIISIVVLTTEYQARNNPNARPFNIEMLIGLIVLVLLMTAFLGGVFHLHGEVYAPWRRKRMLNSKGMLGFESLGFKKDSESLNYNGFIKGYYLTLNPVTTPQSGEWVNANAFLFLKSEQEAELEKLGKKYSVIFDDGLLWVSTKLNLRFNREMKQEKIKKQLAKFLMDIIESGIEPLKVTEK